MQSHAIAVNTTKSTPTLRNQIKGLGTQMLSRIEIPLRNHFEMKQTASDVTFNRAGWSGLRILSRIR
jgi:hypothetical protein